MGVGDQDMGDALARETGEQRLDMPGEVGAGIDHRNFVITDDVCSRAPEGEGAGIARDDPAQPGCHRLEPAVFERELAAEGNLDCHEAEITRNRPTVPRVSVISFAL